MDFPVAGRRERDVRASFALPDDLPLPNLPVRLEREDFHAKLGGIVDSTLTWRDLEWLRSCSPLPLVLKGILTAEDALLAAEHGAAGGDRLEPRRAPARRRPPRRSTPCRRWSRPWATGSRCSSTEASAAAPTS